ncbi:uncharacterized protein LOC124336884 isoform X2 [Daphnia pulicaria]|uniref:uncharacterized protein LOC124336884 isoform X2 n=1 Tax=Daphnia pulicaria TaxID=35523 RepID=UPI001EEC612D|nr:uncharacterized protein LOC124336884 isoform X2 [Daphnia pulicaria]
MANAPVIVIEDNPSNFLEYRLRGRPSFISFEELNLGHSSLRKIAPYALKIRQTALIPTQQFFSYAAVVATIDETSLACIIFDLVNADEIIAYAGHFVTQKNFLFDPVLREPVISDFSLLDIQLYHSHLTLFGTANPNLVPFPDYFLHRVSECYQELVTKSQDMLMSTLQQQNNVVSMSNESNRVIYLLREPLTTSFYHETALPISNKSVERITQKIQPMGSVKVVYGELGSFHSHSYCQPKATEDATNFNAVDEIDGRTTYYSAYEEPGLMPFYYTSYLLGSLRDRHVVGVLEEDNFFIMATKRVYKRNSPAVPISPESLEGSEVYKKIHLPSTLSLSQVLTMLELRQILRHPFMFPDEIEAITRSFGFDESNNMSRNSLADLLSSMNTSSSDFSSASNSVGSVNLLTSTKTPQAPFSTPQANPTTITEIPDVDLAAHEVLFVVFSGEPGSFFGKLGRIPIKDQDEMATELLNVYSSLPNPPLLYGDGKSRLGHHGVLQWNEDQNYHRFRRVFIISELPDGLVEIYFIDFGNSLWIPRLKILAPLDCLNHFRQPPAPKSVLPEASPPLILETKPTKDAPSKFAPQNMAFVPEQIISTHAVAPFAKSLAEFWIQLEPQSVNVIMERIDKFILDPQFVNQKEFSASIGKPCLAFFNVDGFWYRAVIEAIDGDSVTVCYVDYGNSSVLQTNYLRELPLDLIKLPPLAFKCCLDGADVFHKDFAGAFESRLVELSAFPVKYLGTVDGLLRVQLSTSDGVSLVQRQLSTSPLSHAPQNVNFAPEQMISSRAVASYIKSLTELWIQLEPKTVNSIMERLDVLGRHPEFINKKNFVASVGKPCLAFYREPDDFFPDDGQWYRAVVESVNGDTARVYYFDYGHTCEVQTSLLRDLPSDYAKQPALAFKCCLDGAESFSKVAADAFLDRFVKRAFFAVKFLKVVDGALHIRLFTLNGVDLFEKHRKILTPPSSPETSAKADENDFSTPFAFLSTPSHQ